MRRLLSLCVVVVWGLTACTRSSSSPPDAGTPEPQVQSLEAAAQATLARLEKEGARWTARHAFGPQLELDVDVVHAPQGKRYTFHLVRAGKREATLADILEREGYWYVTEGMASAVYRPYQAPLALPSLYVFLARSELPLFSAPGREGLGRFLEVREGVARYRRPLPESLQQNLQAVAQQAAAQDAGTQAQQAHALLEEGLTSHVEVASGIATRLGLPGRETQVLSFAWLTGGADAGASQPPAELTPGLLANPGAGRPEEWVMLAHCGAWRPGAMPCDVDAQVLDVASGALRRVPYQGGTALPGSFFPDRRRVVVSGTTVGGGMQPVVVDLVSGENTLLGGAELAGGFSLLPVVSPDGKQVALSHLPAMDARAEARVMLVDVEGGRTRALTVGFEHSHLSWLPDGKGLVLAVRKADAQGQVKSVISRLALDGTLTPLREGEQPLLLADGRTLLFRDGRSGLWHTAPLSGGSAQRLGDGLPGHVSPAESPDGKRLLFMRRGEGEVMMPVLVRRDGRPAGAATTEGGLWASPRWR